MSSEDAVSQDIAIPPVENSENEEQKQQTSTEEFTIDEKVKIIQLDR